MKFTAGDSSDHDFCIALEHEFLRCHEAFKEFAAFANLLICQPANRRLSYKAFNAYCNFIHHFYEFMLGAYCREREDSGPKKKKGSFTSTDAYINHHAQRVMTQKREAIQNGAAPAWENGLAAYPEKIDPLFAPTLRRIRNVASGHVHPERAKIDLKAFYRNHHIILYWLYRDCFHQWGPKNGQIPDWQEITRFTV